MLSKESFEKILQKNLNIEHIQIMDDSDKHLHHPEAKKTGGGHYIVLIVSDDFEGKSLIKRHRMVYKELKDEFEGNIHALGLKTMTKKEWRG